MEKLKIEAGKHYRTRDGRKARIDCIIQPVMGKFGITHVYLKKYGGIDARTVQTLGTTSAHKLLRRLRKQGYLHPSSHPASFIELPNASGQGCYRWHRWTGNQ